MIVFLPAAVFVAAGFALAAIWRGTVECLPSLGWLSLMAIPYCVEYSLLDPATRDVQGAIILVVTLSLCALDIVAARVREGVAAFAKPIESTRALHSVAAALFAAFVALAGLHLSKTSSIPLIDLLKSDLDPAALLELRNAFSRYLEASAVEKYLFNSAPFVLGAPAVIMLVAAGAYLPATAAALIVALYTVLSSAKVPLTLFAAMTALGALLNLAPRFRRRAVRSAMAGAVALLGGLAVLSANFQSDGLLSDLGDKLARSPQSTFHLGDYVRARDSAADRAALPFAHAADYLLYRVIFTPVEVSSRWYEYFNRYPPERAGLERFITDSKSGDRIHPAQLIGIEQYHSRFPEKYPVETYAYASFDADAYARWGLSGLLVVLVLYAVLRLSIAVVDPPTSAAGGAFYAPGLVLLAALPATASMQAIVAAHGFPFLILLALVINRRTIVGLFGALEQRWRTRRATRGA